MGTNFNVAAPETGSLSLYYWDENTLNNSDFVTVSVSTVPVPAAVWLMSSELMGLIGFKRKRS